MPERTPPAEGGAAEFAPHEAFHRCFEEHVQGLYALLEEPLAFHVALDVLSRLVREHVRTEERDVLPLYEARVADVEPAARAEQYVADHAAILRQLDGLAELSVQVAFQAFPENHLGYALAAFDDLLEHHDLRERRLYPALIARLDERERRRLTRAFERTALESVPEPGTLTAVAQGAFVVELGRAYRAFLGGEVPTLTLGEEGRAREVQSRAALLAERCVTLTARIHAEGAGLDLPRRLQLQRTVDRAWRSAISFAAIELHRARRQAVAT